MITTFNIEIFSTVNRRSKFHDTSRQNLWRCFCSLLQQYSLITRMPKTLNLGLDFF